MEHDTIASLKNEIKELRMSRNLRKSQHEAEIQILTADNEKLIDVISRVRHILVPANPNCCSPEYLFGLISKSFNLVDDVIMQKRNPL